MASTATTRLRLNKQGTGDNLDTWGATLNTQGLDLLDEAVSGLETIALTGSNYTLTSTNYASDEARNFGFRFTGTGGCYVVYPAVECVKVIRNDCTTGAITFGYNTSSGVSIPAGATGVVMGNGTTMYAGPSQPNAADLSALFTATSTSSASLPALGADFTFTLAETNRAFSSGLRVRAAVTADPESYLEGTVLTYSGTTLVIRADGSSGSGTYSAWTISFSQAVVGLPAQSGNGGTFLKTDGATASWATALEAGIREFFVPAASMVPRTTNGPAGSVSESSSNKVMSQTFDYDQTTQEFAQFALVFPKSWDEGTVTFTPYWTASSGSGGVVWALQGVALSNDNALDTAYGTEQTSTDTLIATGDVHVGPESSAITIAGSPAAGDWVSFQIKRNPSDGSDTLSGDAKLLGVLIRYTVTGSNDA